MIEEWRDIPEYEGFYQVSNLGNVRSVTRTLLYNTGKYYTIRGKIRKQHKDSHGYYTVTVSKNNKQYRKWVHRLVAAAFLQNYIDDMVINHIDGCKSNNCISNLEVCTSKENTDHARRIGLIDDYGEHSVLAKLTNQQADDIRKKYKAGMITYKELADQYSVCPQTICNIVNFKAYNKYEGS